MRLSLALSGKRPANEVVEVARAAESAGLDELWITEDYFERGAFALAGGVLAATERLVLGLGVVNPWTRHPVLTAMEAATLCELAPGRVVLGLGASNQRWMQQQLGIAFDAPLARLEEAVELVRRAVRGQQVSSTGYWTVDASLAVTPCDPPVVLGVKGPRALALAGRIADGVLLSVLSSPAYVRWAREQIGTDPPRGLASYVAIDAADARDEVRARMRRFVAGFLGVHGDHAITRTAGIDPRTCAAFRQGWLEGAPRSDLVTDEILDTVAVCGDDNDVAAGLARLAEAGLDTAVLHDQNRLPPAVVAAQVVALGRLL